MPPRITYLIILTNCEKYVLSLFKEGWGFSFMTLAITGLTLFDFHPDTRGGGGHFFRLTCSVVLWGGRDAANK